MNDLSPILIRIAEALERLAPLPHFTADDLAEADAYLWDGATSQVQAVETVDHVDLGMLKGIDGQIETLLRNTLAFAAGRVANNALLWGAKGTGKSSLVKAVHAAVNHTHPGSVVLIEVPREDVATLPYLLPVLASSPRRFILFLDDLSFDGDDRQYKSLKAVLDGGLRGRPANVQVYATSNRRHLMPRDMIENEVSTAINPAEAVEEKVSLSDRFGLWLGFHNIDQETYFAIVDEYAEAAGIVMPPHDLHRLANEWSITRGARSGRVAWQFMQDLKANID
jgi:predicted AAA+ superfamily ATPase